jgi:hypothetical protein
LDEGSGDRASNLGHNKLNILVLKSFVINLAVIVFFGFLALNSLALLGGSGSKICLNTGSVFCLTQLVRSVGLGLGIKIFNLGLAKDTECSSLVMCETRSGDAYIQVLLVGDL